MTAARLAALTALLAFAFAGCRSNSTGKPPPTTAGSATASGSATGSATATASASGSATVSGSATATATATITPFAYEARSPSGRVAFLLGTMHMGVDPAGLPPWVWDRLAAAPAFAMETDLAAAMMLGAKLMRTDGTTLEQELGPAAWAQLVAALGDGPAAMFNLMKPAGAYAQLQASALPPTPSMDMILLERALAGRKRIHYLEAPEVQFAALELAANAAALRELLADLPAMRADLTDGLAAFRAGDETGLLALVERGKARSRAAGRPPAELDRAERAMIADRNASWIPVIERILAEGDAFVAMGAMHLLGPGNVRELLSARGFDVRRVTAPTP